MKRKFIERGTRMISLFSHEISSIDLSQLKYCRHLSLLDLSRNQLTDLELSPLSRLSSLKELRLSGNNFKQLDITPLFFCENLLDFNIERTTKTYVNPIATMVRPKSTELFIKKALDFNQLIMKLGWKKVYDSIYNLFRNLRPQHWYVAQKGFLKGLDMSEISGYDGPPIHLVDTVTPKMSFKEAKNAIYDRTIYLLARQIERTGPTFGLDIEKMATTPASILVKPVIESRRREVENLVIYATKKSADARAIWFSYYGHIVLREMRFSPFCRNRITLEDVVEALEGAGLKVTIKEYDELPEYESACSKGLSQYLIQLAESQWRAM